METNILKRTCFNSLGAVALSLLALDQGAPIVQIFFQIYQKSYDCSVKSRRARELSLPSQFAEGH